MSATMTGNVFDEIEARVIGSLIEKQLTTPEYYPMTLNALTAACNQKQNRDPLMELDESTVLRKLDSLREKGFVIFVDGAGQRVRKYRHVIREKLGIGQPETFVIAELLLRGAQTPGELRGRCKRFGEIESMEDTLALLESEDRGFVVRLPRVTGQKESRYAHLLCGMPEFSADSATAPEPKLVKIVAENERITNLENEVHRLREELEDLKSRIGDLLG